MRFFSFEIVIEKEAEDEGYFAHSPSLPGCSSNGRTVEEAKRNMREAVTQHVASLIAHGEPVPLSPSSRGSTAGPTPGSARNPAVGPAVEPRGDEVNRSRQQASDASTAASRAI